MSDRRVDRALLDEVSKRCLSTGGVESSSHGLESCWIIGHEEQSLDCDGSRVVPCGSLHFAESSCSETRALVDRQVIERNRPSIVDFLNFAIQTIQRNQWLIKRESAINEPGDKTALNDDSLLMPISERSCKS